MYPILFEIGPFVVGSYGVCVLLGVGVGLLLLPRYARRVGLDPTRARRFYFYVFVAGAVGCRLFFILQHLPEVFRDPSAMTWLVRQAGVWYGAILGGLVVAVVLARRWKIDFWMALDAFAVPAVVGGGIGRLGCLLSGCCYGKPTDAAWAITYTNELAHGLHPDLPRVPVHPSPLYELGVALIIAVVLDRFGARPRPRGEVGLLWIALYGIMRSGLEFFRGDAVRGEPVPGLSTSQLLGLASAAAAIVLLAYRRRASHRRQPRRGGHRAHPGAGVT